MNIDGGWEGAWRDIDTFETLVAPDSPLGRMCDPLEKEEEQQVLRSETQFLTSQIYHEL